MSDIQEQIKLAHKKAEENDRKDTISIQDLFNERNEQNKRIEELVLALESAEQRINKAIEYIEKEAKANPDSNRKDIGLILMNYKKTLNILNGVDEE
jgi:hypothetical protein